ncbi:hypothetical protein C8T65DRAFT_98539 [Cerioporus squamosus]|nr:hypothetical protein C8T65DRAFT_107082 [Cerioporus squamosus]KAI0690389.1 hypothetical protein C8T65DRAFT_98539 [Cerioporus squamosus]
MNMKKSLSSCMQHSADATTSSTGGATMPARAGRWLGSAPVQALLFDGRGNRRVDAYALFAPVWPARIWFIFWLAPAGFPSSSSPDTTSSFGLFLLFPFCFTSGSFTLFPHTSTTPSTPCDFTTTDHRASRPSSL